ncbi:MAG: AI-2E family transporter [Synechococcales cyanobacterium C42_A2020_086]|jgi:predicted PurR-regulated permease PerM|nr:AI-2E family transporter [Synechococcales cyanobacterium M58_A2018_015]MBF2073278.1 AI-2E family transporter [Synechococcales cyanobacterium C42_A2020_086]
MKRRNYVIYLHRVLIAVGVVGLFVVAALLSWAVMDVLLLTFLGVLVAIVLRTLAKPIARKTPLSSRWALGVVVVMLGVLLVGIGWLLAPEIIAQTDQLAEGVEEAIEQVEASLPGDIDPNGGGLGGIVGGDNGQWLNPTNILSQLMDTFTLTLGVLANVLFVLFIGLFVAFDPQLYRNGIVSLVPPRGRQRANEVIDKVVKGLQAWLLGRIISMIVVGIVVSLGLWILNVPLALVLGIIAALLEFIPVVGPVLAAVPGILIAFTLGLMPAIYVALFYLVVQQLEGNVLTPIVQQQVVSLPPVLGLSTVLAMGILFGVLGILVATPLTVVIFILVRMLYLRDMLEPTREDL